MPQRDFRVTVELGDGPAVDNSWSPGLAVAADGSNASGMLKGKIADYDDHIIGWTTSSHETGAIASLRTMLDGTISAKYVTGYANQYVGDEIWLADDASGRVTNDDGSGVRGIGLAMEAGKVTGDYIECIILNQKAYTVV